MNKKDIRIGMRLYVDVRDNEVSKRDYEKLKNAKFEVISLKSPINSKKIWLKDPILGEYWQFASTELHEEPSS